jgi:tRNA(fMet)-specific endonuclease VapC
MTGYLLDTNHVSEMLKQTSKLSQRLELLEDIELGLPMPGIGELWYMVHNSARVAENTTRLNVVLQGIRRWEFSESAAMEFGRIKAELRRAGRTIPDVDIQIAAIALVENLTVLTADSHFGYISSVRTENWTV